MTPRNTLSPDEYRVPLTPDGTVEFAPDATGVEQVDFRLSRLDRMTREAISMAEASQPASPERADSRRGEYGEQVIGLVGPAIQERVLDITHPRILLEQTARVNQFRRDAINESNQAA